MPRATLSAEFGALGAGLAARHDRLYGAFSTLVQGSHVPEKLDDVDLLLIDPDQIDIVQAVLAERPDLAPALTLLVCGTTERTEHLRAMAQGWICLPGTGLEIGFFGAIQHAAREMIDALQPGSGSLDLLTHLLTGLAQHIPEQAATMHTDADMLTLYQQENHLLTKALQAAFTERDALRRLYAATNTGQAVQQHLEMLTRAHDAKVAELNTRIAALTHQLDAARRTKPGKTQTPSAKEPAENPFLSASAPEHGVVATRKDLQISLARWQAEWLARQKGILRRKIGPSGGAYADELAKVAASPHFDPDWYLKTYPDVAKARLSPHEHFLRHGLFEGRNPGPNLNVLGWYLAHPDALVARRNPLLGPE
ncbi:MAG: hypothetical protein ACK4HW_00480 [Roseinatronobacter sp.]